MRSLKASKTCRSGRPPELGVDRNQRLEERRHGERREAGGGGGWLQVAHICLEGGALHVCTSQGEVGGAHLGFFEVIITR